MQPILKTEKDLEPLIAKARELAIACQAIVEAERKKADAPVSRDEGPTVAMETVALLVQITLGGASHELGIPRPALMPGVSLAAGMIIAADCGASPRGVKTGANVVESFFEHFGTGLAEGAKIAAR